jgi:hypothetical protein
MAISGARLATQNPDIATLIRATNFARDDAYAAVHPPSIDRFAPVIWLASSLQR